MAQCGLKNLSFETLDPSRYSPLLARQESVKPGYVRI
jgi:hypothetical protein